MRGNPAPNQRSAFTIIEVMIAVAIMSMMLVTILQVLSAVRLTRDRIHNTQETQMAGPIIMDLITEDLRGLHILGRPAAEHMKINDRVLYGLDADRIDFITTTSSREPVMIDGLMRRSQVCEVGYVTRSNRDDDEFLELFRREDFGVDELPYQGGNYTFLSDRVKAFTIEVFTEDGDEAEVITEWGSEKVTNDTYKGLPASIVITLTLENTPRLLQEQLEFQSTARMTVTYQRTVRIPEAMRKQESEQVFLMIPSLPSENGAEGDDAAKDPKDGADGQTDPVTRDGQDPPPVTGDDPKDK
ncbi:MAG: prepilin-type N-terminal cleavage/methylation domain-containing protein [Planctomycetota bacterium]|nr:prepilin-type N-terminal cleavage/methylation domain-containing protein [Planctomycetota bacterium]